MAHHSQDTVESIATNQGTELPISNNPEHTRSQTGEIWCHDVEQSIFVNDQVGKMICHEKFDLNCLLPPTSESNLDNNGCDDSYISSKSIVSACPADSSSLCLTNPNELSVDLSFLSADQNELGCFLGFGDGLGTANAPFNLEDGPCHYFHLSNDKISGGDGVDDAAVENKKQLEGLSETNSEQANEGTALYGHGSVGLQLQGENSKENSTLQTESAAKTDSSAVPYKGSKKVRTQSGKQSRGPQHQSTQKERDSAEDIQRSKNQAASAKTIKKNEKKLPPATQQFWQVKGKGEPSQASARSSLQVWQVKERTGPEKDAPHKSLPSKVKEEPLKIKEKSMPSKDSSISSSKAYQDKKRIQEPSNDSSTLPTMIWRVKEKAQKPLKEDSSKSSSRRKRSSKHRSKRNDPKIYQITWKGCDESDEPIGQACMLCEIDLAYEPTQQDREELKFRSLPDVAVLPCSHTFHMKCLEMAMPEEMLKDPSCFICLSQEQL